MVSRIILLLLSISFVNAQIALPTFQGVHIQHSSCASTSTLEVRISHNNDDAEERENNQGMYLTSTDLELVYNGGRGRQQVGMRFLNITIPQGTVIKNTYIRFTVDEIIVNHRQRKFGDSKYGTSRIFHGFFDLITVLFLNKYFNRPLHLFGSLGFILLLAGIIININLKLK